VAIAQRVLLAFDYEGYPRIVAPYCHGFHRSGEALRGVQIGGGSRSGSYGIGKSWIVAKMKNVRAMADPFVPDDPDYNPDDVVMLAIHCRI
jgi:hypothetical protein